MEIRHLFTDEDAVSSVISTVLMVAITIILVAVVGSFVLDLGATVGTAPPAATLAVSETNITGVNDAVVITHQGGDTIPESEVTVKVNGQQARNWGGTPVWDGTGELSATSRANISRYGPSSPGAAITGGEDVVVVWASSNGERSSVLVSHEVTG